MLTKKTFTSKDNNGCEFKVLALYGDTSYTYTESTGKWTKKRDCDFYAFNNTIHAKSLKELKEKVSNLP